MRPPACTPPVCPAAAAVRRPKAAGLSGYETLTRGETVQYLLYFFRCHAADDRVFQLVRVPLQSAETDYKKMLDEEQMRSYKLKQLKLDNQTKLTDLQMKIKVSAMKLDRMKVELRNEQYLDSLGSGTTDKVRQAELSYNVAQLEYEQLQQQYANEKEVLAAE